MTEKNNDWKRRSMISRLVVMGLVLTCCVLVAIVPFFSLEPDAGALFAREFTIDFFRVTLERRALDTGIVDRETVVLWGMIVANVLVAAIAIMLPLLPHHRQRDNACVAGIVAGAAQYGMAIAYYFYLSDAMFVTMAPRWSLVLPAVVIELFLLKKRGKI